MQYGPVAQTLDRDQHNTRYMFPDGTFNSDVFDRAMAFYNKAMNGNISMFFPRIAQSTLDTMNAQRGLTNSINNGGLRDDNGAVTAQSFGDWLNTNKAALTKSQSQNTVMWLQAIQNALQGAKPGELADTLKSELLPAGVGAATFGLECGVLGTLLHKSAQSAFGGLDAKRQAAFSQAIERATLDPNEAASLVGRMNRNARYMSPTRALVRAAFTAPIAANGMQVDQ